MIKKILIIATFFLLTSCGYEPIYIEKNNSLQKINKINLEGNEKINRKILSIIRIKTTKDKTNSYLLKINSKKKKDIVAKDSSGDVTSYKLSIIIKISLIDATDNEKVVKAKEFQSSYIYNNANNKFQLSQDEKNILDNLIESNAKKIVIYLNS